MLPMQELGMLDRFFMARIGLRFMIYIQNEYCNEALGFIQVEPTSRL